jgi:hypothetical protein
MGTIAKQILDWFKIIDSKVSIVTDYFTDTRKDLLIRDIPVSGIVIAMLQESSTANAGTVKKFRCWISDYKDNLSDDFSISIGYNVTF